MNGWLDAREDEVTALTGEIWVRDAGVVGVRDGSGDVWGCWRQQESVGGSG